MPPKKPAIETEAQPKVAKASDKKRKHEAANGRDEPNKIQRRSGRGGLAKPSTEQLLKFLLSKEAEELTRPDDEVKDVDKRGEIKTYSSSAMNPFEELLCAIVLSRPISHRLGLRTIRTVLNDPYNFSSAKAVKDAGNAKQHQALWDARTQHKDKTAQQLGRLADVVLEKFASKADPKGTELSALMEQSHGNIQQARAVLKSSIKGLGPTGLDIFCRRVQWLWSDVFPFIDSRTVDSLRKLGLPHQPAELKKVIDDHWKVLSVKELAGSGDAQKKRRAFVVVLERAVGADLEGKIETVLSHASA